MRKDTMLTITMLKRCVVGFLVLAALGLAGQRAAALDTPAEYAVLMDYETGQIIYSKRGSERMAPASMSKLMTMVMLFDAIQSGKVAMDDTFRISENAWKKGGAASGSSTMFAEVNSEVPVEDLIRGVIVQSGNDACIAIAEGLAGSEEAFARAMTRRGKEIGLKNSTFQNSTGWPDEDHMMTAEDLAILARHLIKSYPEFYGYYAEETFTWNNIRQANRNPLLYNFSGADGLKTGHTSVSGYGLVGSAVRDGRRLIMVINGLENERARASEAKRLMAVGFTDFKTYDMFEAGAKVAEAEVWDGQVKSVPLVVKDAVQPILHKDARAGMTVKAVYDGPIQAPISEGQEIGSLVIAAPGYEPKTYPIYAGAAVAEQGLFGKMGRGLVHLLFGSEASGAAAETAEPAESE